LKFSDWEEKSEAMTEYIWRKKKISK